MKQKLVFLFILSFSFSSEAAQIKKTSSKSPFKERKGSQITYHLNINYKSVNLTGKDVRAMAINDSLPAPTLDFKEGDTAIIHVTNNMDVESSIHWHGILLPNFQDGVPYLTTPPILPGQTYTYKFPLKQSGTYWYHSHTGLQEQRGLYGALVIEPQQKTHTYDHNLVLVLSDWTDENPNEVMRTLKRGSEWYSVKKETTQSLSQVIANKALLAQLKMWKSRMPGMDISDVYYPAFLVNGKQEQHYPQFKAGEKIRLRVINASASTYFWLTFGGKKPLLISADGLDVQPVPAQKILQAIGETYDLLITVPKDRSLQFRAMAQDGSGTALAHIGKGKVLQAPLVPKPDLFQQMKDMAKHHHGHSHHKDHSKEQNTHIEHTKRASASVKSKKSEMDHKRHSMKNKKEDHKSHKKHIPKTEKSNASQIKSNTKRNTMETNTKHFPEEKKENHRLHEQQHETKKQHKQHLSSSADTFSYQELRSLKPQTPASSLKEITLNLNGNMWRYVWSMNNKTLSESDKIQIKRGERLRITLDNKTMMHHPMHLHGHFFRVLTKQGKYSPLKHTVDIPPMETLIIEFDPDEEGDWFFHCHVLYHMMGGMTRIFSHNTVRDKRLKKYPAKTIINKDNQWYLWGEWDIMSHRTDLEAVFSNTRNKLLLDTTFSWFDKKYRWHQNFEASLSYERFTSDFFRIYTELEVENRIEGSLGGLENTDISAKLGIRYLLPYLIGLDLSLDHKARLEIELDYELLLSPRLEAFADWSLRSYLDLLTHTKQWEQEWSIGWEYILSKNMSLKGSYSNHFGWGAGLNVRY